jgi:hypothetical protein
VAIVPEARERRMRPKEPSRSVRPSGNAAIRAAFSAWSTRMIDPHAGTKAPTSTKCAASYAWLAGRESR